MKSRFPMVTVRGRVHEKWRDRVLSADSPISVAQETAIRAAFIVETQRNQWLPREALANKCEGRRTRLVRWVYDNNEHYRRTWTAAGVQGHGDLSAGQFRDLPILSKSELSLEVSRTMSEPFSQNQGFTRFTSGSSGTPTNIPTPRQAFAYYLACYFRSCSMGGTRPWHKLAYLKPVAESTGSYFGLFSTEHVPMVGVSNGEIVTRLRRSGAHTLVSQISTMQDLTQTESPEVLAELGFKTIVLGSELSTQAERDQVSAVFGATVVDEYSAEETWAIASQCEFGSYHIASDNVFVEVIRDDGSPCAPGEVGKVLVTSLTNRGAPIIRYDLGDVAAFGPDEPCQCGRTLPTLKHIEGRSNDFFILPGGSRMSPHSILAVVLHQKDDLLRHIMRCEVHQATRELVHFRYVSSETKTPALPGHEAAKTSVDEQDAVQRICASLQSQLGPGIMVLPERVMRIGGDATKRSAVTSSAC